MFQFTTFRSVARAASAAIAVAVLAAVALPAAHAQAKAGKLDNTFNASGKLVADVLSGDDLFADIVVQPDGKTIAVGSCAISNSSFPVFNGYGVCATRYNLNGALDTTFGDNGVSRQKWRQGVSLITADTYASSVALQSDGKIVIGGTCQYARPCIIRLTPSGAVDFNFTTFVKPGSTSPGGGAVRESSLAIQPDGKILMLTALPDASGFTSNIDVLRFNGDGTLDTTFGSAGLASVAPPTVSSTPLKISVHPNTGKITTLGRKYVSASDENAVLARFNATGSLDTGFNSNATVAVNLGPSGRILNMRVRDDSSIDIAVIGANSAVSNAGAAGSIRLLGNGARNTAHGTNGILLNDAVPEGPFSMTTCEYRQAIIAPDGRITFLGTTKQAITSEIYTYNFCRIRVDADITIDNTFVSGTAGFSIFYTPAIFQNYAMAFGKNGTIIAGAACNISAATDNKFCLQRYEGIAANASCYDVDGDGVSNSLTDGLIIARALLGFRDTAVTAGIGTAAGATRTTWPALRDFMAYNCGMRELL